jgi:ecdysteroid 25-hydroxylase CYP306A1
VINYLNEGKKQSHEVYESIIHDHVKRRKPMSEDEGSYPVQDLIDAFLEEKDQRGEGDDGFYSSIQFNHLLADMFGAGLDTTVTSLQWLLLFMAQYSDEQVQLAF